MTTPLTREEKVLLRDALLSAFNRERLAQFMTFSLDERLDNVVEGSTFFAIVGNLVSWAEERGRLDELILKVRRENPGNPKLRDFERAYRATRAPPPVDPPPPTGPELPADLRTELLDALLAIPALASVDARTKLLEGIRASSSFLRNEGDARRDLELIVDAATALGRDADGVRPLRVLVDNAKRALPPSDARGASRFEQISRRLGEYYGGEAAPARELGPTGLEALSFAGEDARLPLVFLERAIAAGRGVARLRVERIFDGRASGAHMFGTAWLIAPGIVITNHHVVDARDRRFEPPSSAADFLAQARGAVAWFDYHLEGGARTECAKAELLASDATLDYAILALADPAPLADRAPLAVAREQPVLGPSTRLNIVQHAGGGPQKYAIRNNFYVETVQGVLLRYLTDTEPGASGSPVTDDSWQVVALHHAARRVETTVLSTLDVAQPKAARFHNEGVAIHAILAHLGAGEATVELRARIAAAQGLA